MKKGEKNNMDLIAAFCLLIEKPRIYSIGLTCWKRKCIVGLRTIPKYCYHPDLPSFSCRLP